MGKPPWEEGRTPDERPRTPRGETYTPPVDPEEMVEDWVEPDGPAELMDTLMEGREEALVRAVFEQIRELTVTEEDKEESRPNVSMGEEPPDVEDMEVEDWFVPSGAVRVDAEGRPISQELLWDAMEAAEREGLYPENGGFEWWVHDEHYYHLREELDPLEFDRLEWERDEEYRWGFMGIPGRSFPVFPKGAVLLIDPSVLDAVHKVGQREPAAVEVRDPRRIVRVTGIGRPE